MQDDENSSQPNTSSDDNDVVDSPNSSPNCIYIDSVDSGRSSDTGTHQSWSSSSGSSTKSRGEKKKSAEKSPKEVQIVPHNFCDYLGSIKRRISPTSTASSSYASMSSCQKNKVRVYVPYSTLIALTNEIRETPVDDVDEPSSTEDQQSSDLNENVLICDTQVILRINPSSSENDLREPKRSNRRMTKRLLNESEAFSVVQEEVPSSIDASKLISKGKLLPKRKDLCKLLGLNEQDVDLMIVPEVKVAQKVALNHLDTTADHSILNSASNAQPKNTAKKKDLAKFLGVEEVENDISKLKSDSNATATSSVSSSSTKVKDSSTTHSKRSSLLINWGQMVKSSVKGWKLEEDNEMEMDVPVQLRQIPAREPNRQHRKDLSKFLGFDDSDSEEIVFIRNHANPSINDSSLTRKSSSFEDDQDDQDDSDDSVGSLRSFDSFVRRSLRCGASSEFAIQIEEGVMQQNQSRPITRGETVPQHQNPHPIRRFKPHHNQHHESNVAEERMQPPCISKSLVTLDRPKNNPQSSRSQLQKKEGKPSRTVVFGPNSRRMISPVRNKPAKQSCKLQIPPVFLREEPLIVYPQKPALFYQHYPLYANYGILPPGGRINPSNGRVRVPRSTSKRPSMSS